MADEQIILEYMIKAQDQARAIVEANVKVMSQLVEGIEKMGGVSDKSKKQTVPLVATIQDLKNAVDQTAGRLLSYVKESTRYAANVEMAGTALKVAGKNAGYSSKELQGTEEQIKKLGIATNEARQMMTLFIQSQLDIADAGKLARAAQDLAVNAQMNSSQAAESLTYAISAQSVEMLRQFGLVTQSDKIFEQYGKTINKAGNALTQTEQKAAFLNAVLDFASASAGTYESAMEDVGKQMTSLTRYTDEAMRVIGEMFLPIMGVMVKAVTEVSKAIAGMSPTIKAIVGPVIASIAALSALLAGLTAIAAIAAPVMAGMAAMGISFTATSAAAVAAGATATVAMSAFLVPILVVTAAVAALVAGWLYYQNVVNAGAKQNTIADSFEKQRDAVEKLQKQTEALIKTNEGKKASDEQLKKISEEYRKITKTQAKDFTDLETAVQAMTKAQISMTGSIYQGRIAAIDAQLAVRGYSGSTEEMQKKLKATGEAVKENTSIWYDLYRCIKNFVIIMWEGLVAVAEKIWEVTKKVGTALKEAIQETLQYKVLAKVIEALVWAYEKAKGLLHDVADTSDKLTGSQDRQTKSTKQLVEEKKRLEEEEGKLQKGVKIANEENIRRSDIETKWIQMAGSSVNSTKAMGAALVTFTTDIENYTWAGKSQADVNRMMAGTAQGIVTAYANGLKPANDAEKQALRVAQAMVQQAKSTAMAASHYGEYGDALTRTVDQLRTQMTGLDSTATKWKFLNDIMKSTGVRWDDNSRRMELLLPLMEELAKRGDIDSEAFTQLDAVLNRFGKGSLTAISDQVTSLVREMKGTTIFEGMQANMTAVTKAFEIGQKQAAEYGGVFRMNTKYFEANKAALLDIAVTAPKTLPPVLLKQFEEWLRVQQTSDIVARQLVVDEQKLAVIREEGKKVVQERISLDNAWFKLGHSTIQQQIRDATVAADAQIKEAKRSTIQVLVAYAFLEKEKQKAAKATTDAVVAANDEIIRLAKATASIQILEAARASEYVVKSYAEQYRKINDGIKLVQKQMAVLSLGGLEGSKYYEALVAQLTKLQEQGAQLDENAKKQAEMTVKALEWADAMGKVGGVFSQAGSIFTQMSGGKGSTTGSTMSAIGSIFSNYQQMKTQGGGWSNMVGATGKGNTLAAGAQMAGNVMSGVGGFMSAMDNRSQGQRVAGGAASGAQIGGSIVPGWGHLIGAAVGAFIGAVYEPRWVTMANDVGKKWGTTISDALGKEMEANVDQLADNYSKAWGLGTNKQREQFAEALSIGSVIKEAGGVTTATMKNVTAATTVLFDQINHGSAKTKEAVQAVNEAFTGMIEHIDTDLKGLADQAFLDVIKKAKESKSEIKAVTEYLKTMGQLAVTGFALVAAGVGATMGNAATKLGDAQTKQAELAQAAADSAKKLADLGADSDMKGTGPDALAAQKAWDDEKRNLEGIQEQIATNATDLGKWQTALDKATASGSKDWERMGRFAKASMEAAIASGSTLMETMTNMGPGLDAMLKGKEGLTMVVAAKTADLDKQIYEQKIQMSVLEGQNLQDSKEYLAIQATIVGLEKQKVDLASQLFSYNKETKDILDFRQWINDNVELAAGVDGLNQMMKGLTNSGATTQAMFEDFGAEATRQFGAMQDSGLASDMIFKTMQPSLQTLWELQDRFGYAIDDTTKKLLEDAAAAGVVGELHKSASERMVDGINKVVDRMGYLLTAMGVDFPAAVEAGADRVDNAMTNQVGGAVTTVTGALAGTAGQWSAFATNAENAARRAEDAVNHVTFGSSPGGIKEIPLKLQEAMDSAKQFSDMYVREMGKVYSAVNKTGGEMETLTPPEDAAKQVEDLRHAIAQMQVNGMEPMKLISSMEPMHLIPPIGDAASGNAVDQLKTDMVKFIQERESSQGPLTLVFKPTVINPDGLRDMVQKDIMPEVVDTIRGNKFQNRTKMREAMGVQDNG